MQGVRRVRDWRHPETQPLALCIDVLVYTVIFLIFHLDVKLIIKVVNLWRPELALVEIQDIHFFRIIIFILYEYLQNI